MGVLSSGPRVVAVALLLGAGCAAGALETDQFYAWRRPMDDGSEAINGWIRGEIAGAVAESNAGGKGADRSCADVALEIRRRLYFFIFQEAELWASHTPLLDRIPDGLEEGLDYRRRYLFRTDNPLDMVGWMPPSPTIESNGVRFGTDKLSHFASLGWLYHRRYQAALRDGMAPAEAAAHAIRFGILSEKTIFGASSTGAVSIADLEANYQGMLFYNGLCDGERPILRLGPDGWAVVREFDLREHVSPEWDESWNPPVFRKRRWERIRKVMAAYCSDLDDPLVRARRDDYRSRDRQTPTETIVAELVREGRLPDPAQFGIESVCGGQGKGGQVP